MSKKEVAAEVSHKEKKFFLPISAAQSHAPFTAPAASPEVAKVWATQLETLERENQALRATVHMNETDPLSDIHVDAVAKIHEQIWPDRIIDLEIEFDKINMKKDDGDTLPQKTSPSHPDPSKDANP